ncbi:MAG: AtpZ/AtpI family protein [Chloroflexi bacterium]|nr:AtpZ/AtpI family protein [Chloroflexota bacterium]MBU1746147.1 AtpZ/AtpI family protein [Chloroflexota bacterium]MBU1877573.1 AtpZ/AtpI family protein [Chloroflexota bacterium]
MPASRMFVMSLGAGTLIAVFGLGGMLLGAWLDTALGTAPWLALLMALVGLGVGLYPMYRLIRWGFKMK